MPLVRAHRIRCKTFRIGTSYSCLLSPTEQTGMLDRILKEAFQRNGFDTEIPVWLLHPDLC